MTHEITSNAKTVPQKRNPVNAEREQETISVHLLKHLFSLLLANWTNECEHRCDSRQATKRQTWLMLR